MHVRPVRPSKVNGVNAGGRGRCPGTVSEDIETGSQPLARSRLPGMTAAAGCGIVRATQGPCPAMPEARILSDQTRLDIVTVVYGGELAFLRLQAASLDRFLDPAGVGRVVVVVNDIDESGVAAAVEALRPDYGRFAGRLVVRRPDELFGLRPAGLGPRGPRQRFRLWMTRHRRAYPFGVKGGWRGNRGWSVQQALKLAAARDGDSRYLLLLDAKNHFVRPVSVASFVAADGRARSFLEPPGDHARWVQGSFRRLGLAPPDPDAPAPPTITPYPVARSLVAGCLDALEARVGPAEAFFARARRDASEFMLVYAHAAGLPGGWSAAFAEGLVPPASIFRDSDAATIDRALARAESGEAEVFSLHSARIPGLAPAERARIAALWRARGLPAEAVFPEA